MSGTSQAKATRSPQEQARRRESQRVYAKTEKGLATYKRYNDSQKGIARVYKYQTSPEGKLVSGIKNRQPERMLSGRLAKQRARQIGI